MHPLANLLNDSAFTLSNARPADRGWAATKNFKNAM
jgi:hypothetical protein